VSTMDSTRADLFAPATGSATPESTKRARAKRAAGLCTQCRKPADYGCRCAACAERGRKAWRAKYGNKPWQAGMRGRPPLEVSSPNDPSAATRGGDR
jgi:hypothetical protein